MIRPIHSARASRGIALPVVLLLLLAITIPAVVMLRQSLLNENMASATREHEAASQVAESALATAEELALTRPTPPATGCENGVCATPDPAATPLWYQDGFWDSGTPLEGPAANGATSRYFVEYMGKSKGLDQDCTTGGDVSLDAACNDEAFLYRITVLGQTPTGARAMLQTAYLVP